MPAPLQPARFFRGTDMLHGVNRTSMFLLGCGHFIGRPKSKGAKAPERMRCECCQAGQKPTVPAKVVQAFFAGEMSCWDVNDAL